MKHLYAFLILILVELTGPNGEPVYVVPASVADVTPYTDVMNNATVHSKVRTFNGHLLVRETPSEVVKRLRDAKD